MKYKLGSLALFFGACGVLYFGYGVFLKIQSSIDLYQMGEIPIPSAFYIARVLSVLVFGGISLMVLFFALKLWRQDGRKI